ncbi:MAG TPA: IPExxxVDY family protein [Flavihumibacter sp.]|jgi:hypothetical protein
MKLKLDVSEMAEDFFGDAHLLGIVAPVRDYQFCWNLNNQFRFNFRINIDLEIQLIKKGRRYFFPVYEHKEPQWFRNHYLYRNQHDGEYLLPEFRHLDFLWLIKGDEVSRELISDLQEGIRSLNGVQLVVELTNEKIKNKEHLIF